MPGHSDNSLFPIQQLLETSPWPHKVETLQLLETHISWVILTGLFAYKIKKPVVFDFVDYSTLSRRKHFCKLEVELNRRFSSGIYVDVVPIYKVEGQLRVAGQSIDNLASAERTVEYAVKMRQFEQDSIAANRLDHAEMNSQSAESFGRKIASFQAKVQNEKPPAHCGTSTQIQTAAMNNFRSLVSKNQGTENDGCVLVQLKKWTLDQLEQIRTDIDDRYRDGFVRCGHGDMHLANVIQRNGSLVPFDGIEFNPELNWIDVANEIAFPVMDFIVQGRPDMGWRLLNSWLESTGDFNALTVMRFFLVYRALVRAKVAWLARSESMTGDPTPESTRGAWEPYIMAAAHFAFKPKPSITITHGLSGSGKSTRAISEIEKNGGVRIRSDIVRGILDQPSAHRNKYDSLMTERVYQTLHEIAARAVNAGFSVVVDATFLQARRRTMFRQLADELAVPFSILDCNASAKVLCQRIKQRRNDPSEATIDVLQKQIRQREPLTTAELQFSRSFQCP